MSYRFHVDPGASEVPPRSPRVQSRDVGRSGLCRGTVAKGAPDAKASPTVQRKPRKARNGTGHGRGAQTKHAGKGEAERSTGPMLESPSPGRPVRRSRGRMLTPNELTVRWLNDHGWAAEIVERRVAPLLTRDAWGCIDVAALRGVETLLVQATRNTGGNHRERVRRLLAHPMLPALLFGLARSVEVWSWPGHGQKLQYVRVTKLSVGDDGRPVERIERHINL